MDQCSRASDCQGATDPQACMVHGPRLLKEVERRGPHYAQCKLATRQVSQHDLTTRTPQTPAVLTM